MAERQTRSSDNWPVSWAASRVIQFREMAKATPAQAVGMVGASLTPGSSQRGVVAGRDSGRAPSAWARIVSISVKNGERVFTQFRASRVWLTGRGPLLARWQPPS